MEWIRFLRLAPQEGGCKLFILSSISTLVNKLLQGEKARFLSAVIVSPGAAGSWGVRERVSQRIILIAMTNADKVREAKGARHRATRAGGGVDQKTQLLLLWLPRITLCLQASLEPFYGQVFCFIKWVGRNDYFG